MREEDPAAPITPDWIRQERLRHNWSQTTLAEKLGTTRISISRWESGITYPNLYFRHQLYTLFGLPPARVSVFAKGGAGEHEPHVYPYPSGTSEEQETPDTNGSLAEKQPQTLSTSNVADAPDTQREQVIEGSTTIYRQHLIGKVRACLINEGLELSLYGVPPITVTLYEARNAVDTVVDPSHTSSSSGAYEARTDTPLTSLTQVYDEAAGKLLLLGPPGSGKTTLLLALARDLLNRAEHDAEYPIPVIFHLASWEEKHLPLAQWLLNELVSTYQVPQELGQEWIEQNAILPLLDGLDIVLSVYDGSSILRVINTYLQTQQEHTLVVCSRSQDYFQQPDRLVLPRAVAVQPLTWQQISASLTGAGEQFSSLYEAFDNDPVLQEAVTTPLAFQALIHAYHTGKTISPPTPVVSHNSSHTSNEMTMQQMLSWKRLFNKRSVLLRIEYVLLLFVTITCLSTLAFLVSSLNQVSIKQASIATAPQVYTLILPPIGPGQCDGSGYFELFFSNREPICYANAGIVQVNFSHVIKVTSGNNHGQFDIDGHPQSIGYRETQTFPSGVHITRIQIY